MSSLDLAANSFRDSGCWPKGWQSCKWWTSTRGGRLSPQAWSSAWSSAVRAEDVAGCPPASLARSLARSPSPCLGTLALTTAPPPGVVGGLYFQSSQNAAQSAVVPAAIKVGNWLLSQPSLLC